MNLPVLDRLEAGFVWAERFFTGMALTSECLNLFRFAARGRDILNFVASGRPIPPRVT